MDQHTKKQLNHILIKFYLISSILFVLLLTLVYFTPKLIEKSMQDDSFPNNIGLMKIYGKDIDPKMWSTDGSDDSLYSYNSIIRIDGMVNEGGGIFSRLSYVPNEVFDLGLPVVKGYLSHEFYDIELLYGIPNVEGRNVIIDESVALALFDSTNVVGETISAFEHEYVITGVMKDIDDYDVLMSIDIINEAIIFLNGYEYFLNSDYKNRIYDEGGMELLSKVESIPNQYQVYERVSDSKITMILTIIFTISYIGIRKHVYQKIEKDFKQDSNNKAFIKQMIAFSVYIMAFVCIAWIKFASTSSFYIAFHESLYIIKQNLWLLNLYFIPIINYFNKNFDLIERSEIIYEYDE